MDTKHTPGPWVPEYATEMRSEIKTQSGSCIADVWALNGHVEREEMKANARLIAAAPETAAERDKLKEINAELLGALERIAIANEFDVSRGRQCAEEMRQIARAAIAKATGGA